MEDDSLAQAWQRVCDAAGIDTTGPETVREVESLVQTGRNYLAELRAATQQVVESHLLHVTEVRETEPRFTIIVDENCAESAATTSELAGMVAAAAQGQRPGQDTSANDLAEAADRLVGAIDRHLGEYGTLTGAFSGYPDDGDEWAAITELHTLAEAVVQNALPDEGAS